MAVISRIKGAEAWGEQPDAALMTGADFLSGDARSLAVALSSFPGGDCEILGRSWLKKEAEWDTWWLGGLGLAVLIRASSMQRFSPGTGSVSGSGHQSIAGLINDTQAGDNLNGCEVEGYDGDVIEG